MLKITPILEEHLELILKWRLTTRVSKFMTTAVRNSMTSQLKWYKSCQQKIKDGTLIQGLIAWDDKPIGFVQINDIDLKNFRASWGFYIGDEKFLGVGAIIPDKIYHKAFLELGLNKLVVEVFSSNRKVLKMHKLHGYRTVGVLKEHIMHGLDVLRDITVLELFKKDWLKMKYPGEFEEEN